MDARPLIVPISAVNNTFGCAFDIGSTMAKIIYKSKEPEKRHDQCKLCFETVRVEELEQCLRWLKENAALGGHDPSRGTSHVVHTTGITVRGKVKDTIANQLHARIDNLPEFSLCVDAFKFLVSNVPKELIVVPPPVSSYKQGVDDLAQTFDSFSVNLNTGESAASPNSSIEDPSLTDDVTDPSLPYDVTDKDLFPCVLATIGSAGTITKIEADGSSRAVDGTERGGKYLMGMASLIVGTTSYDELMELAEKGDDHGVSNYFKDLKAGDAGDAYDAFPDDMLVFRFGKAISTPRECLRREDLARAVVANFTSDLSQTLCWLARACSCKRVFLGGGVFKHDHIRDTMFNSFVSRSMFTTQFEKEQHGMHGMELHFLRHGVHLGALGALLQNNRYYSQAENSGH